MYHRKGSSRTTTLLSFSTLPSCARYFPLKRFLKYHPLPVKVTCHCERDQKMECSDSMRRRTFWFAWPFRCHPTTMMEYISMSQITRFWQRLRAYLGWVLCRTRKDPWWCPTCCWWWCRYFQIRCSKPLYVCVWLDADWKGGLVMWFYTRRRGATCTSDTDSLWQEEWKNVGRPY